MSKEIEQYNEAVDVLVETSITTLQHARELALAGNYNGALGSLAFLDVITKSLVQVCERAQYAD